MNHVHVTIMIIYKNVETSKKLECGKQQHSNFYTHVLVKPENLTIKSTIGFWAGA